MARKGKVSAGETFLIGMVAAIGGVVWLVSQVPVWAWVTALALVGAYFAYREYRKAAGVPVTGLPVRAAADATGAAVWVPAGHAIQFAGLTLPGGMLYVGKSLPSCKINEAAFDEFDEALAEGEDPVVVNLDTLDKLSA